MLISGGLRFDVTSTGIEHRYLCTFCQYLLVEPKCTACGHRYCSTCLQKMMKYVLYIEFHSSKFFFLDLEMNQLYNVAQVNAKN